MSVAKQKGTLWESAIVAYLRARGWPNAERRALNGAGDRGDIAGIVGLVIEAKSAARLELSVWMNELRAEVRNDGAELGAVWVKRRGKSSPADGFVIIDGETFTLLLGAAGYGTREELPW